MSASPDDMTSMLQNALNGGGNSLAFNPLLNLAMGLLKAGGPSRMPVSTGQAFGEGAQEAQQAVNSGLQYKDALMKTAMQRAMLGPQLAMFKQLQQPEPDDSAPAGNPLLGGSPVAPTDASAQPGNSLLDSAPQAPSNPLQTPPAAIPGNPLSQAQPPAAVLPPTVDITKDPKYMYHRQRAEAFGYMGNTAAATTENDMAQAQLDKLKNQWTPLTQDQDKLVPGFEGGLPAGYTLERNPLGEVKPVGEDSTTTQISPDAHGVMVPQIVSKITGKPINPSQGYDVKQPLPDVAEAQAQLISRYGTDLPQVSSRNPMAGYEIARAQVLNPGLDTTRYDQKRATMQDMAAGGKTGDMLNKAGTAAYHLQILDDYATALKNGNTVQANRLKNAWLQQTGSALPTNMQALIPLVGAEVAGAYGAGAVSDRDASAANLSENASPAQIHGVVQTIIKVIGGKVNATRAQYEKTTGFKDFDSYMPDVARKIFGAKGSANKTAPAGSGKTFTYDPTKPFGQRMTAADDAGDDDE